MEKSCNTDPLLLLPCRDLKSAAATAKKNVENLQEAGNIKKRLKYSVIIDQPYILLPRGYSNDLDYMEGIKGTLGKILVSNDYLSNNAPPPSIPPLFRSSSLSPPSDSLLSSSWNGLIKEQINIFISNCNLRSGYLFHSNYDRDILTNTNLVLVCNLFPPLFPFLSPLPLSSFPVLPASPSLPFYSLFLLRYSPFLPLLFPIAFPFSPPCSLPHSFLSLFLILG